jgi:ribosome-associated protein
MAADFPEFPSESPDHIELAPGAFAPAAAIRVQYSRGRGPGGQNVNKVNTRAQIWIKVSEIRGLAPAALLRLRQSAASHLLASDELHFASDRNRTQEANRADVFQRIGALIEAAMIEPLPRRKTRPTRAARRRRLDTKRRRAEIKSKRGNRDHSE